LSEARELTEAEELIFFALSAMEYRKAYGKCVEAEGSG
jgi:hypothetical protein